MDIFSQIEIQKPFFLDCFYIFLSSMKEIYNQGHKKASKIHRILEALAVWTGLEPATPCVTGRYSNQLNYHTV